jgi:Immunity protein Imm1
MPISSLTICDWASTGKRDRVIKNPSWADVESAIRSLDNESRNDIYLKPFAAQDTFLGVGGGAGRYIVHGSQNGKRFPTLTDPTCIGEHLVPLCVGGQLAEYPARRIVGLEQALAAVRSFYEVGDFDCGVKWEYV